MQQNCLHDCGRVRIVPYLIGAGLTAVALWVELWMTAIAGGQFRFLAFSIAVAITAWQGGLWPGVLAIVLACVASDYFLLGPGAWLRVDAPYEAYALAGFFGAWLVVCVGVDRVYRRMARDIQLRGDAERNASQADRLAQLASALGRARSSAAVIEAAVQEPLNALRASAGMLLLVSADHRTASVARAVAYEATALQARDISLDDESPLRDAVHRGAAVVLESGEAWRTHYPDAPAGVRLTDYDACVVVPLRLGSRVMALARFDFRAPPVLGADDHEYVSVLGSSAGQALDRARQLESAQRALAEAEALRTRADQELIVRQQAEHALRASETRHRALSTRTARMHDLTAALSEAVTVDAVATAVVQHGSILVGATAASVSLLVEQGTQLDACHAIAQGQVVEPLRGLSLEAGLCATDAVRTGSPVFVSSWGEAQDQYWRSASVAADAAYMSSAVLPLLVDGAPIGVVEFHFSVPVNFDAEYQALLISVAQHCAQALDRARLYETAQSARREAETANRLKDEFLSIVSHELRTPLNAVVGWSSMLRDRSLSAEITDRAVHSIYENAMRQARLIDDLLDVSRMTTGQTALDRRDVSIDSVLAAVIESLLPTATVDHITVTARDVPSVVVSGDRRRLEQVFFNLLGNALKFTPSGGEVTIEGNCIDEMVEIRVHDTGEGIEPAFLPHVFDRFRQGDGTHTRSHGGLGLGLAIAKQLVEAHGGTVAVESDGHNHGATFSVRLPILRHQEDHEGAVVERERAAPANEAPRLFGIHVVVVDDEPTAREVMTQALQRHGARVTSAASAADAMEILNQCTVDVVLADIAMPGEDGYSFIRRIRASKNPRLAAIPAAAVTAHARHADRELALAAGFQRHLAKPVDPIALARTVEQLLDRGAEAA